MTNEELMNLMTDMGLHEGGMENWVMDNAWVEVAKRVAAQERRKCEDEAITKNIVANWPYDKWVGLTDEEYQTILGQLGDGGLLAFYILIESKLKEKNT